MKSVLFAFAMLFSTAFMTAAPAPVADGSIEVTLSCGIEGTLSWEGDVSTSDIIDAVMYFDDLLC